MGAREPAARAALEQIRAELAAAGEDLAEKRLRLSEAQSDLETAEGRKLDLARQVETVKQSAGEYILAGGSVDKEGAKIVAAQSGLEASLPAISLARRRRQIAFYDEQEALARHLEIKSRELAAMGALHYAEALDLVEAQVARDGICYLRAPIANADLDTQSWYVQSTQIQRVALQGRHWLDRDFPA